MSLVNSACSEKKRKVYAVEVHNGSLCLKGQLGMLTIVKTVSQVSTEGKGIEEDRPTWSLLSVVIDRLSAQSCNLMCVWSA